MKRLIAIFLVLFLLTPVCGIAEESTFVLRNGYRWGLSRNECILLAQEEGLERKSDTLYLNVPVGNYYATMLHLNDRGLTEIIYYFAPVDAQWDSDANRQMYDYLFDSLTSVYGSSGIYEPMFGDTDPQWAVMPDTLITLMLHNYPDAISYCSITYSNIPLPTPTPVPTATPEPIIILNNGF